MTRNSWPGIVKIAGDWVRAQPYPVTLRQVHYYLVATQVVANTYSNYKTLSKVTTRAREAETFPELEDKTRTAEVLGAFEDLSEFALGVARHFHLDRTRGQEYQVVVAVEKRGLVDQVFRAVGERGWMVVPVAGYGSHTIKHDVAEQVEADGRPSVLLYLGDFDASGMDIERDFVAKTDFSSKVIRVALTAEQVAEYDLPTAVDKERDSRAAAFAAQYGHVQVEIDALPMDLLRDLLIAEVDQWWDRSTWEAVVAEERALRAEFRARN